MVKKIRLVLLFGSIYVYQHFAFLQNGYLYYLFFVVKNNAVPYPSNVARHHSTCDVIIH